MSGLDVGQGPSVLLRLVAVETGGRYGVVVKTWRLVTGLVIVVEGEATASLRICLPFSPVVPVPTLSSPLTPASEDLSQQFLLGLNQPLQ